MLLPSTCCAASVAWDGARVICAAGGGVRVGEGGCDKLDQSLLGRLIRRESRSRRSRGRPSNITDEPLCVVSIVCECAHTCFGTTPRVRIQACDVGIQQFIAWNQTRRGLNIQGCAPRNPRSSSKTFEGRPGWIPRMFELQSSQPKIPRRGWIPTKATLETLRRRPWISTHPFRLGFQGFWVYRCTRMPLCACLSRQTMRMGHCGVMQAGGRASVVACL